MHRFFDRRADQSGTFGVLPGHLETLAWHAGPRSTDTGTVGVRWSGTDTLRVAGLRTGSQCRVLTETALTAECGVRDTLAQATVRSAQFSPLNVDRL